MKFLSIKEYFYKLNTLGFIVLLLPIITFIFLYLINPFEVPLIYDQDTVRLLLIAASSVLILDLTIVHWVYKIRLTKMKSFLELAKKMDGFYSLMLMKFSSYCGVAIMAVFGYFLTNNPLFTIPFAIAFMSVAFQWPGARYFCNQFGLKGNDREMIINGGDLITRPKTKKP